MIKVIRGLFIFSILLFSIPGGVNAQSVDTENIEKKMDEAAAQVSSTLDTAKKLIRIATTTTGIAVDTYNKGAQAVSSSVEVVRRGSAVYENIKPIISKIGDAWNTVTNNNEFWRVALVVTGIILIWIVIRYSI